jgi:protease IV
VVLDAAHRPLILEVDFTTPLAGEPADPLGRLSARGRRGLRPTLRALHEAGDDSRVTGLVAKVGGHLPWPAAQELRLAVSVFVASGKPAVAWAESFGEGSGDMAAYLLASAFPEIWLQPSGGLGLLGIAVETTFLRGALDQLGLQPQLEQRYEFKNAADRVMRTGFTAEHRESLERLTGSIFEQAVSAIAEGRGLTADHVRELVDTGPRTASEAQGASLIDRLGYRDEVYASMRSRAGADARILFADRWQPRRRPRVPQPRRDHVALVEVVGIIGSGHSFSMPIAVAGSDSVAAALRAAGDDDHARAVVLRIDSRGGSAVASDTIWREVHRLREAGKPVVASMGDVAASGGYFVACPADVIVALPATLTGSIGVVAGKVVAAELLERFGLATGTVSQGDRALMFSTRQGFTPDEQRRFSATVDAIYDDFVAKVAAGRGRSVAEIEAVARGRVWTGADARDVGLVDELGGLREAVRLARSRAGLAPDAPVRPALRGGLVSALRRPKSSEDPRAAFDVGVASLSTIAGALGMADGVALYLPSTRIR